MPSILAFDCIIDSQTRQQLAELTHLVHHSIHKSIWYLLWSCRSIHFYVSISMYLSKWRKKATKKEQNMQFPTFSFLYHYHYLYLFRFILVYVLDLSISWSIYILILYIYIFKHIYFYIFRAPPDWNILILLFTPSSDHTLKASCNVSDISIRISIIIIILLLMLFQRLILVCWLL